MKKLVVQPAETITSALQKIRFWPELGDYIDLQMAPAVISSQINPDRDKISQFSKNNYFCDETHIFSSHTISAATDSSNDPMRLEINQGTELGNRIDFQMAPAVILSQIYPDRDKMLQFSGNSYFYAEPQIFSSRTISAPADSSNNPIEIRRGMRFHRCNQLHQLGELEKYSANLSAVDADALLTTQLTVMGFPSGNYQQYLNFSLRLDRTSQHLFQRTLHDARAQTLEILSTLAHQVLPFKPCPGLQQLLKQERRRRLRSAVALPKAVVRRETCQTRLETDRVHFRALSDSRRASCQTHPADSH